MPTYSSIFNFVLDTQSLIRTTQLMQELTHEQRTQAVNCLIERRSIRATVRMGPPRAR